jgi:hypothetical protein
MKRHSSLLPAFVNYDRKTFHTIYPRGGFVEHLSLTKVTHQSLTENISLIFVNLVTPKARPKHDNLFKKPASGLLCYAFTIILS